MTCLQIYSEQQGWRKAKVSITKGQGQHPGDRSRFTFSKESQ